jgi:hypothetical protein
MWTTKFFSKKLLQQGNGMQVHIIIAKSIVLYHILHLPEKKYYTYCSKHVFIYVYVYPSTNS